LYQRLIRFHLKDVKPAALIDVDIDRIEFAKTNSTIEEEDKIFLYRNSLKRIAQKYPGEKEAALALYMIAASHAEKARQYDPLKDTAGRYDYVIAKRICEQILERKDSSLAVGHARILLQEIQQKEISMQAEKVNLPAQPFRVLVNYRNFTQLYFRIVKIDKPTRDKIGNNYWEDEYWKTVLSAPTVKTFTQSLPAAGDYQKHSTEIKIDALPVGDYVLLASTENAFVPGKNMMSLQFLHVSNIAWVNRQLDYFALHRETGQPLANADVQLWLSSYDYNTRKWKYERSERLKTDKNGFFRPKRLLATNIRNISIEITTSDDHLLLDENAYTYFRLPYPENKAQQDKKLFEEENRNTYLFTDRSIYRPGQTVYFKGIAVTRDFSSRQSKIVTGLKTKVFLQNANREKIDSLVFTTNDFGSYSGKFRLPENTLNGDFLITDDKGEIHFSVEEYKRPKFYVEIQKPSGSYRVNDTIEITGLAKAYAGNNIDGATIKYRVVRTARFPYPWLLWKRGYPRMEAQEIAHGVVKSDADGKFSLKFEAVPDKKVNREFDPVFNYEITADVTDINGETRSGSSTVSVSYKALQLAVTIPPGESMPADSLKSILVRTTNLAGEFVPAPFTVS
ncbi:MAG: MG2 domain-containing protein, partial [Chitinophagaceae bacterium]